MVIYLAVLVFFGVWLIGSIRGTNCPIWQMPMGLGSLVVAIISSFDSRLTWPGLALGWSIGGVVAVSLILIVDARHRRQRVGK